MNARILEDLSKLGLGYMAPEHLRFALGRMIETCRYRHLRVIDIHASAVATKTDHANAFLVVDKLPSKLDRYFLYSLWRH